MSGSRNIVFFDFDGTLTTKDVFIEFLKYSVSRLTYYLYMVRSAPFLILFFLKIINNEEAKQKLFSVFFKGMEKEKFMGLVASFYKERFPQIMRSEAVNKLQWHIENGDEISVVSANFDLLLSGWCLENKVNLIATCVEVMEGKITGKFNTRNCYGNEKVKRIKELYDINQYKKIYAYGDSRGDREMLEMATEKFFRKF